jgi:hypothetical protein
MYKICFYVPESHLEIVKQAMFAKGAGKIGNYSHCCWQVLGEGQFMPLAGSDSFVGEVGVVEKVREYKVEMVCEDGIVKDVIAGMKKAHPYEEAAYQVWLVNQL